MSFTRLLAQMASIVRNTVRPVTANPGAAIFMLTTRSNARQQQVLELIAAIAVLTGVQAAPQSQAMEPTEKSWLVAKDLRSSPPLS